MELTRDSVEFRGQPAVGTPGTGASAMTTTQTTTYRSAQPAGRDGFGQLLRAEWTKLRTVRGWVIALILAAALTAVIPIALAGTATSNDPVTCAHGICQAEGQTVATGPAGEAVTDNFYFVHQALAGDGSITARVSALHGSGPRQHIPPGFAPPPSTVPWAKAGLMIKASTKPGAAYAAVMLTGDHGVRMQYDFTHDVAGSAVSASWLRLTRSGDSVTGYESSRWTALDRDRHGSAPGPASHRAGRPVCRLTAVQRGRRHGRQHLRGRDAGDRDIWSPRADRSWQSLGGHDCWRAVARVLAGQGARQAATDVRCGPPGRRPGRCMRRTEPSRWLARVTSRRLSPSWTRCTSRSSAPSSA